MKKPSGKNLNKIPREIRNCLEKTVDSFKLENFGFGEWVYKDVRNGLEFGFNPAHQGSKYPWIRKPFLDDMSHFDCFEAAIKIWETLWYNKPKLNDFSSCIGVGEDMYKLFREHYFNIISWKRRNDKEELAIDAVPIFPLYEDKGNAVKYVHDYEKYIEKRQRIFSFNESPPLSALADNGAIYISIIHIHSPVMQPLTSLYTNLNKNKSLTIYNTTNIEMVYSILKLKNGKVKNNTLIFKLDYSEFKEFNSKEKFNQINGEEIFNLLIRENIMTEISDISESKFISWYNRNSKECDILSLEKAPEFLIFQRDKEHIGNYASACLLNYRQ